MALVEPDVFASVFAEMPLGPVLALALDGRQAGQLDDFYVVEMARAARRLAAWATSIELSAVAELSARRRASGVKLGAWDSEIGEWTADEVAAALTLSGGTAAHLVVMAEQLATTLPLTFEALEQGRIDADKARVIADGVRGTRPGVAARVEGWVLADAPRQTCGQLRYAVRKAVCDADPDGHAERRAMAEDGRRLELWDCDAGTSDLTGRDLPATAATAAWNRINAIATALKTDGDPRTIDQLRADVYLALLRNEHPTPATADGDSTGLTTEPAAGPAARPAQHPDDDPEDDVPVAGVVVARSGAWFSSPPATAPVKGSISSATMKDASGGQVAAVNDDADDEQAVADAVAGAIRDQLTQLTGHLNRDGRIRGGQAALVKEAVRRIKAATAELNARWCTSEQGEHGADSYRVPARMRRRLQARDGTCRFPGCRRGADQCDADHTEPHHKGGATCPCNLSLLCRRHHRLKQRPEWHLTQVWHGVMVWIAPTGHWHVIGPG